MKSNKTGLAIGLLAGAAIAAYAVSKISKESIQKLGAKTADLRNSLTNQLIELKKISKTENRFI